MTFVIANDKKIKLIKLRKEFVNNFRGAKETNEYEEKANRDWCSSELQESSSFVDRFN